VAGPIETSKEGNTHDQYNDGLYNSKDEHTALVVSNFLHLVQLLLDFNSLVVVIAGLLPLSEGASEDLIRVLIEVTCFVLVHLSSNACSQVVLSVYLGLGHFETGRNIHRVHGLTF